MNMVMFILGMVTVTTLIPIIESFTEVICTKLEKLKSNDTVEIIKTNKVITNIQNDIDNTYNDSHAIGFQVDDSEGYYVLDDEEDEFFEEDKKTSMKIGFVK